MTVGGSVGGYGPVPSRVRVLAWSVCVGALPTLKKLARGRPTINTYCALCGADIKSLRHVRLECPYTRLVWALSNISWRDISNWMDDIVVWISGVLQRLGMEDKVSCTMLGPLAKSKQEVMEDVT
ncbi:UNVERIFIED_CONTAM: hypothetical protein Sangu_0998700 [Sesamum angustifolium]|uniref:Reverse transcriptase zinc-binding domain-containing protein n=1 Tax=Sesamum angustifolium TaxID=2727405 RepID=A0AAW2PH52_9LAMI